MPVRSVAVGFTTTMPSSPPSISEAKRCSDVAGQRVAELAGLVVTVSTEATTSSCEQAQAESWALLSTSRCHASSRRRYGYRSGGAKQRVERFGDAFERALGGRARLVDIDAVRRDAHEHVVRAPGPQLAPPLGELGDRLQLEVLGQRGDRELVLLLRVVGFGDDLPEPGLREVVIGAVHQQQAAAVECRVAELELVVAARAAESLGVTREVASVRVRAVQVLGAHA